MLRYDNETTKPPLAEEVEGDCGEANLERKMERGEGSREEADVQPLPSPRARLPAKNSASVFYVSTNETYGWRPSYDVKPSEEVTKAIAKKNQSDEEAQFLSTFWQSTSSSYGGFGFEKNTLCNAMDDLKKVKAAKHVIKDRDGPAPPNKLKHSVDLKFKNYEVGRKSEHKIYTTTSNDIGAKKPQFDTKLYPHMNQFTNTFLAGMQRDCGLNTNIPRNRYHDDC